MTKEELHSFIDRFYFIEEFKPYELTNSDLYKFKHLKTQKQKDKAQVYAEKKTDELRMKYGNEVKKRNLIHTVVDSVSEFPTEIAQLLYGVIEMSVNGVTVRHERYDSALNEFIKAYGEDGYSAYNDLKYHLTKPSIYNRHRQEHVATDESWWNNMVNQIKHNWHLDESTGTYVYDYPLKSISDWKTYVEKCKELMDLRDNDDISNYGKAAYTNIIDHASSVLERVMSDIKTAFEGRVPDGCETDPHWGIDGHFNAVLKCGSDRVSFVSFGAGGFNIQRYHFRHKVTKLKN